VLGGNRVFRGKQPSQNKTNTSLQTPTLHERQSNNKKML
jgi:hypothetical protein